MRSKTSEIDLHRSVADFLSWVMLPPAVWTTFPAGWTFMRAGAAGRLKGCGLKAGMPDILIFYASHTIGIELKTGINKPSPMQLEMFNRLQAAGIHVYIAHNIDEVRDVLDLHNIPMRRFDHGLKASKSSSPKEPTQGEGRTPA